MSTLKFMNGHGGAKITNGTINGDAHVHKDVFHPEIGHRYTYESLQETVEFLRSKVPYLPEVGVICGSGLGSLAECLDNPIEISYDCIPHFPRSTVKGHVGALVFGFMSGLPTVCMKGRFHYYEGYPLWKCCMPIRIMKLLGVSHLFITNAAGGLNPSFRVGDIMFVKDHINLMGFAGNNPLQGPNDERFGPRFPPMNQAYNREIIKLANKVAKDIGLGDRVHEGVYTCLGGPNFETVAELRMLQMLGADAVGMSTVHEVITANHCDMTVFVFSLITNECIVEYESLAKPSHEEVIDVGTQRENSLKQFVKELLKQIFENRIGTK
ncbi:purine nucleoside phosphorylase-like isoform X2 [Sitophilus oryzae]|uniref:Purine nucleoside phosphorylase n=1 Tax=Sitophilus oryzae TaxID=7048 RepID=A0A6J2X643_SITOR|nr:purine nucleoside phosphorylase-like isoform X2 [Sitophilus oryzae]